MATSRNRTFFFSQDNNEGFASGQTVTQKILEDFVYSTTFLIDDDHRLVPEGGNIGDVLQLKSENLDGTKNAGWLDISEEYVSFESNRILPDVSLTAFTGYILYKTKDGSKWDVLPSYDFSAYLTKSGASVTYLPKTQLYNIVGNSSNTIVVLDDSTNKIPNSLLSLTTAETYKGVWNASSNSPTLGNNVNNGINPPPYIQPSGNYYIVSTSGTSLGNTFQVGDRIISNGTNWQKAPKADIIVSKVNDSTGEVNVSFLRDSGGGGDDLTKAEIETHIVDDDRHLTTTAQTIEGVKTFTDIPKLAGLREKNVDEGIIFQDAIAFSGDASTKVFEFVDNTALTASTSGYSTVPTTTAIKGYVDTKRNWSTPHLLTGSTYEAALRVSNDYVFTSSGLTNYQTKIINSGGDSYFYFDLTLGYEPSDINFLKSYVESADILGTGSTREIFIDTSVTPESSIPEQLKNKRLFFGTNVTTSGSSALYVDIRTINPYTGNYETIPFNSGNTISLVPDYDNWSQYNENTTYFAKDVTVKENLKVLEKVSVQNVLANTITADVTKTGYKLSKQTNNALILSDASTLSINEYNSITPTAPNTYIKLPKIGKEYGVIEGTKVIVSNIDNNYTMKISTGSPVSEKILKNGNSNPVDEVTIQPYSTMEFVVVDLTSSPQKWIVREN